MKYFLSIFSIVITLFVKAQEPYAIPIDIGIGLPSNAVFSINQDPQGFIWIASDDGICRFDGVEFVTYSNQEQTSKSGSNILMDKEGRVWYQNFDGFCYYLQNGTLTALQQSKPLGFLPLGLTQKHLFVVQQNGIDVYDIKSLKRIKTLNTPCNLVKHTGSNSSYYYFLCDRSIFCVDSNLVVKELSFKLPNSEKVHQIYPQEDALFITSKHNENRSFYELTVQGELIKSHNDASDFIQGLSAFEKQRWVLSARGARVYEGNRVLKLFPEYSVSCVFRDRHGNFWIGTTNKGILLVPKLNTRYISLAGFEPSIVLPANNGYSVFTKKDEWLNINVAQSKVSKVLQNKGNSAAYYAYLDPTNHNLFVSSFGTTFYPHSDYSKPQFSNSATKEMLRIDHKYYAFAASGNAGILRSPNANSTYTSLWDSLFNDFTLNQSDANFFTEIRGKSVSFDTAQQAIYFATNNGLFKRTLRNQKEVLVEGKRIYCNKIISYGSTLFLHLPNGLLYSLKGDTILTLLNTLPSILMDNVKRIKAFGEKLCIMGDQRVRFVSLSDPSLNIGELPLKFNHNQIPDILLEGNKAIVLTHNGLIETSLSTKVKNFNTSDFVIHKVTINGKEVDLKQAYNLSYKQNNLLIHFSLLDYIGATSGKVAYSLNNEDWVTLMPNSRSLEFASLAPGNYSIRFKVMNTVVESANLDFTIAKPFWLNIWFIMLMTVLVISLLYAYYKWQINLLMNKNKLVTEKMALENELNKSVLTSIKSQMNPHFFYNALNTIQSYIFINDKKNASNYLSKFSKLTRMILEMSEKEYLRIGEEIEALKLYLELEKMRFEDNLHYEIKVDLDIDIDLYKVPPMLIQPYVENAIKHGLLHTKKERKLCIEIKLKEPGFIEVIIDDNGIGRQKSMELSKFKLGKHNSFATKANETRLAILNKDSLNKLGIQIIDKISESGEPQGTKVILQIPIY